MANRPYLFLKDLNFAGELLEHTALFKGKTLTEKRLAHLKKIEKLKVLISEFSAEINRHEEEMKNLIECEEISCDMAYQERHECLVKSDLPKLLKRTMNRTLLEYPFSNKEKVSLIGRLI